MGEILRKTMTGINKAKDPAAIAAETLLVHYSFDLNHWSAEELVQKWLQDHPAKWLRLAIIEALYQGRYKSISVEQILMCWHRRSKAMYHFNLEFERLICAKLPGVNIEYQEFDPPDQASEAESPEKIANSDQVLTKNLPISPMVAKSQTKMSDRTTTTPESDIPSQTDETPQAVVSPSLQENQPKKIAPVANSTEASNAEKITSKKVSELDIKRQIITELLDDPWLDERDEEIIENILKSGSNSENSSVSQNPGSQSEKSDSLWQANPTPIHEFTPTADPSEFYTRLKSVLEHKLNHPEEEHRKRRSKKPR